MLRAVLRAHLLIPEAILAREMEICYLSLAMITDYDVWQPHPVNAEGVIRTMKENLEKIKKILESALPKIKEKRNCFCNNITIHQVVKYSTFNN